MAESEGSICENPTVATAEECPGAECLQQHLEACNVSEGMVKSGEHCEACEGHGDAGLSEAEPGLSSQLCSEQDSAVEDDLNYRPLSLSKCHTDLLPLSAQETRDEDGMNDPQMLRDESLEEPEDKALTLSEEELVAVAKTITKSIMENAMEHIRNDDVSTISSDQTRSPMVELLGEELAQEKNYESDFESISHDESKEPSVKEKFEFEVNNEKELDESIPLSDNTNSVNEGCLAVPVIQAGPITERRFIRGPPDHFEDGRERGDRRSSVSQEETTSSFLSSDTTATEAAVRDKEPEADQSRANEMNTTASQISSDDTRGKGASNVLSSPSIPQIMVTFHHGSDETYLPATTSTFALVESLSTNVEAAVRPLSTTVSYDRQNRTEHDPESLARDDTQLSLSISGSPISPQPCEKIAGMSSTSYPPQIRSSDDSQSSLSVSGSHVRPVAAEVVRNTSAVDPSLRSKSSEMHVSMSVEGPSHPFSSSSLSLKVPTASHTDDEVYVRRDCLQNLDWMKSSASSLDRKVISYKASSGDLSLGEVNLSVHTTKSDLSSLNSIANEQIPFSKSGSKSELSLKADAGLLIELGDTNLKNNNLLMTSEDNIPGKSLSDPVPEETMSHSTANVSQSSASEPYEGQDNMNHTSEQGLSDIKEHRQIDQQVLQLNAQSNDEGELCLDDEQFLMQEAEQAFFDDLDEVDGASYSHAAVEFQSADTDLAEDVLTSDPAIISANIEPACSREMLTRLRQSTSSDAQVNSIIHDVCPHRSGENKIQCLDLSCVCHMTSDACKCPLHLHSAPAMTNLTSSIVSTPFDKASENMTCSLANIESDNKADDSGHCEPDMDKEEVKNKDASAEESTETDVSSSETDSGEKLPKSEVHVQTEDGAKLTLLSQQSEELRFEPDQDSHGCPEQEELHTNKARSAVDMMSQATKSPESVRFASATNLNLSDKMMRMRQQRQQRECGGEGEKKGKVITSDWVSAKPFEPRGASCNSGPPTSAEQGNTHFNNNNCYDRCKAKLQMVKALGCNATGCSRSLGNEYSSHSMSDTFDNSGEDNSQDDVLDIIVLPDGGEAQSQGKQLPSKLYPYDMSSRSYGPHTPGFHQMTPSYYRMPSFPPNRAPYQSNRMRHPPPPHHRLPPPGFPHRAPPPPPGLRLPHPRAPSHHHIPYPPQLNVPPPPLPLNRKNMPPPPPSLNPPSHLSRGMAPHSASQPIRGTAPSPHLPVSAAMRAPDGAMSSQRGLSPPASADHLPTAATHKSPVAPAIVAPAIVATLFDEHSMFKSTTAPDFADNVPYQEIDGCCYFNPNYFPPDKPPPGTQYGYPQRGKRRKALRLSSRFPTQAGKFHHHANFYVKSCAEITVGGNCEEHDGYCE